MHLSNEDIKYKIINASPTRLVIVTYEIVLDRTMKAKEFLKSGDLNSFRANINNAREFITELMSSLDMSTVVAGSLFDLYSFVNKLLSLAYFKQEEKYILEAENIIIKLMNSLVKEVDDSLQANVKTAEISETYGKLK